MGETLSPLQLPFKYRNTVKRSPTSLLFSREKTELRQSFFKQQFLQPFDHLCGCPVDPLHYVCNFLELWGPELNTVLQVSPDKC